jgi:hypothetical protein
MVANHFQLSDDEFELQFQNATLNPKLFSHEAHLRLAWIHINKYGLETAYLNICNQIKQFDALYDDGRKYNHTMSIAAVHIVNHFMQMTNELSFSEFIIRYPRLKTNFSDLLYAHYSPDIIKNQDSKYSYLEPDRLPF